jgi:signal transduction histidine kinase
MFRVACLFVWLFGGIATFIRLDSPSSPQLPQWEGLFVRSFAVVIFLVLGWAFWRDTLEPVAPARGKIALLAVQILLTSLFARDLSPLVAAQIPFVLLPRPAFLCIAIHSALLVAFTLPFAGTANFYLLPGISHLPLPLGVSLTFLSVLSRQAFSFCIGYMAASEARSRGELARVNVELLATQEMLADSSRLAERLEIARELHDSLGHHLTVLSVNLELAKQLAAGRAAEPVQEAQAVTRLLLADVREVVSSLREDRTLDLRHALAILAAGTPEPRVHLTIPEELRLDDPARAHALFRCVQEILTNTVRHARARNLWLEVAVEEGGLTLTARDDGRGTADVEPGNGLRGMRERLAEVGGWLEIDSRPGAGFSLHAWLPAPEDRV